MKQADEEVGDAEQDGVVSEGPRHRRATPNIAPVEASIASRTPPSSTSIALVNHA
jgi:hypothetical protein